MQKECHHTYVTGNMSHTYVTGNENTAIVQKNDASHVVFLARHIMLIFCNLLLILVYESIKESLCQEHFEKVCQINFIKKAIKGIVKKCYNPFEKVCDGSGPASCKTFHETSCTTRYEDVDPTASDSLAGYGDKTQNGDRGQGRLIESEGNLIEPESNSNPLTTNDLKNEIRNDTMKTMMGRKLLGVTKCEKIPVKLCGKGCRVVQKGEKCYNTEVDDLRNVPEEQCELNPRQSCRNVSKLVPKLKPVLECSMVPKEFCALKYGPPKTVTNEQKSIWCLDEA